MTRLPFGSAWTKGKRASVSVEVNEASVVRCEVTEEIEAADNSAFPVASGPHLHIEWAGDHRDRVKQLLVDPSHTLEHLVLRCVPKDQGRDAFLYDDCPATILVLVHHRVASAFASQEGAGHWRPAEEDGVGEVEDVVVAVAVLDNGRVGQRVSGPDPVEVKFDYGPAGLTYHGPQLVGPRSREPFSLGPALVEGFCAPNDPAVAGLLEVRGRDLVEPPAPRTAACPTI